MANDEPHAGSTARRAEQPDYAVAIMGAGFSGLGLGARLRQAGEASFVILERAQAVGGTWRDNRYPGSGCDIASHLYSYSFEPNPAWSQVYASQPEILAYIEGVVERHALRDHIRFGAEVVGAAWDEAAHLWRIRTGDGRNLTARVFVTACGQLSQPAYPPIAGRASFAGEAFHTAAWRDDVSLAGQRVAVIGSGASAVQLIPEIVAKTARLTLFQRTPGWVVPKMNRAYDTPELALFKQDPEALQASRERIYQECEERHPLFGQQDSPAARSVARGSRAMLEAQIEDPDLRRKLTPDHGPGCKRLLLSDDFYAALARPNAEVVTDRITQIEATEIVTADGARREVDVIIYATGFDSAAFTSPTIIIGAGGASLDQVWGGSPRAHLGLSVAGFPNLFMLYGPNTGLGHNSMLLMIEAQIDYVLQAVAVVRSAGAAMAVKPAVLDASDAELQTALEGTAWAGSCTNWYKGADGRIFANWAGTTQDYVARTRRLDLAEFDLTPGPGVVAERTSVSEASR